MSLQRKYDCFAVYFLTVNNILLLLTEKSFVSLLLNVLSKKSIYEMQKEMLFVHCFHIKLELRSAGFWVGRETGEPKEKTLEQVENQQQIQPTYLVKH